MSIDDTMQFVPLDNELASVRCQNERNKVTHSNSKALHKQQSLSQQVLTTTYTAQYPSLGSIIIKEGLNPRGQRDINQDSNFKEFCRFEM